MRALRKGQAAIFNLTQDIRGEARIVERAFSIGACALAEAVAVIQEELELQPAGRSDGTPTPRRPVHAYFYNRATRITNV